MGRLARIHHLQLCYLPLQRLQRRSIGSWLAAPLLLLLSNGKQHEEHVEPLRSVLAILA